MILRGLHLENWRCIAKLDLENLPLGIVVLHGPNRTGKSSLVKALRCCLFDYDHNTVSEKFRKNIPWHNGKSPQVVVEFETGGALYRLTKVFSTRVDGQSLLEKWISERWHTEEQSPKEATRKAKELLGANKSDAGLNQLLWLDQGQTTLPKTDELDAGLENRLMNVLGVLVTGQDQAFKTALDKRWEQWFTPTGRPREVCSFSVLERQRLERKKILEEEEQRFREVEQAISRQQECTEEQPRRQRAVEQARQELEQLSSERLASLERRRLYQAAEQASAVAQQKLQIEEAQLTAFLKAQKRCQEGKERTARDGPALQQIQEERDRLVRVHEERLRELQAAQQAEESHRRGREGIEDHRKLLALRQRCAQLDETLAYAGKLETESAKLDQRLHSVTAPEKKVLDELRQNRRQAGELRAQLRAAALTLAVTPRSPAQLRLVLDRAAVQEVQLEAEQKQLWLLRQEVDIELPGWGALSLTRNEQNQSLEECARNLTHLDRHYQETVRAYREDPADEQCLDRLAEKRFDLESWMNRRAELRKELQQKVVQGTGVLENERQALEQERQILLQRRPDLLEWRPHSQEVEDLFQAFETRAAQLEAARRKCQKAEEEARKALPPVNTRLEKAKLEMAALRARAKAELEELERLGDESSLRSAVAQAREAASKSQEYLAQTQLTEAEKTIDERCRNAESAVQLRGDRLHELEGEMNRLRGRLEGSEGLHIKRADAEVALREVEQAVARERLEADAHRHLRDLFEECREGQIQRVMGPISGRVLEWARYLGLDDYREVRFQDHFLPAGIVLQQGDPDKPIALDDDSYGTGEQLSLLVRLALGGVLAEQEPVTAILDDPLAHADPIKHRRILEVLKMAAEGNPSASPATGRLQILILTCHPDRFDYLTGAQQIDLAKFIVREG